MSNYNDMMEEPKNKANELYNKGKEKVESFADEASHLYAEGKMKLTDVEQSVCEQTEELKNKVKENPLVSLLIAGSIGYLLSYLLKK
ncbi:hypothetical protein [Legionella sainthelensi]|uniref:hypothetical protein n=1 Tax=Legionella sainthelensi TaxID=28087 RepID=UPI000C7ADFF7|nr:hypothetical protein [Legionella sainthelensi]AYK03138.1 DUF883 domain-containing protein [Legionella sainthelensi]